MGALIFSTFVVHKSLAPSDSIAHLFRHSLVSLIAAIIVAILALLYVRHGDKLHDDPFIRLQYRTTSIQYVQKKIKKCKKFLISRKSSYICSNRVRHASRKISAPGRNFYFINMEYSKQPLSIYDIIPMLRDVRGLVINDEDYARKQLSIIGYFRIANYLRPMESDKESHIFKQDSTFENALNLYYFDKELRSLIFTAIQSVEIGIRALVSQPISLKYGPYWYLNPDLCVSNSLFNSNEEIIRREIKRSKEDFIKEHTDKYPDSNLPSWKALEIISFGTFSKIFCNLSDFSLKKKISRSLGLPQHKILENWLQALSSPRNFVAHHSRIWNRVFPGTPTIPSNVSGNWIKNVTIDNSRLYAHLCCLEYLQNQIHPDNDFSAKLKQLIKVNTNVDISAMGFPDSWTDEPLWK